MPCAPERESGAPWEERPARGVLPAARTPSGPMTTRRPRPAALAAPLLLWPLLLLWPVVPMACQATAVRPVDEVRSLLDEGRYREAVELAARQAEESPDDPRAQTTHRGASVAYLLEAGRRLSFQDDDVPALEAFEQAHDLDPEASEPIEWIDKTKEKLADRWSRTANERQADDDLPGALDAYEESLRYSPDDSDTVEQILQVKGILAYREGLSQDYYNQGLRAWRDIELWIAASRFDYAGKYRDDDEKPRRRVREVKREIAARGAERGQLLEEAGMYAAARTEYRIAHMLDEDNPEALDGLERMTIEAEAHGLLRRGEMWIRRGQWVEAIATLTEGMALTAVQQERFRALLDSIDDARIDASYQDARDLEEDFLYEQAIERYAEVLEARGFHDDARSRHDYLVGTVAEVERLYAEASTRASPEAELALLRNIQVLWPEFRDVQARLDALIAAGVKSQGDG